MNHTYHAESVISRIIFTNKQSAILWLIVRLYLGYEWLIAGWEKFQNPVWWGDSAGGALSGFIQGALQKTTGVHPDVYGWYASFLQNTVLPNAHIWSEMVTLGEILIGISLILGLFVGISAFFGSFMNFNFLLAGTVSVNPVMLLLGILLILSRRVAGYIGLDYYVLPKFHRFFKQKPR